MSNGYAARAIQAVQAGQMTYCKFLTANDTGVTGAHQAGIYVSKSAVPILFASPGERGKNQERWVNICWQDDFTTRSRFIYYGQGSRNEYRITNFGRHFPFLESEYTGALFVLVQDDSEEYEAFVLNEEEEIDQFLDAFGLTPAETNRLMEIGQICPRALEKAAFASFIQTLDVDFPTSQEMSAAARAIHDKLYNHAEYARSNPDARLLDWTDMEYRLFRAVEFERYGSLITRGFATVEEFINTANVVLNRRKSRAGKSLEHHLDAIFTQNGLRYTAQAVTEGKKKPDFLFPSEEAYHDDGFPTENLISLAAKTTCKDRWRQILNEADRLKGRPKYLCTLQQGVSPAQMDEMRSENVILVVPKPYLMAYPPDRRDRIWTLAQFIAYVRQMETV